MRTSLCNGNSFTQKKGTLASFFIWLSFPLPLVAFLCLQNSLENREARRAYSQLLNSLSQSSLPVGNFISVSLRNENKIMFALSRMCDWHSQQYVIFILMLYNIRKTLFSCDVIW